jgi:hypothetical protein
MKRLFIAITLVGLMQPAQAQVLQGAVSEEDAKPAEHCICVNPNKVHVTQTPDGYQLADDDSTLFTVRTKEAADGTVSMIKEYAATDLCSLGPQSTSFNPSSIYFKTRTGAPDKALTGEADAIKFDTTSIKAEQKNGSWKLTSAGDVWLLDFGANGEAQAKNAAEIIRYYGFGNQCFLGNPSREVMYWHK